MGTLSGKSALVTGSTSGIGLAIATVLAGAGADITLNGFGDPAAIEKLRKDLAAKHGVRVRYHGADISKPAETRALIAGAESEFGRLDILVNNAGIQFVANTEDFPDDKWDAILAINLSSSFHAIKAAIPTMKKRGWGRIVNIASAHGLVASAGKVGYVAAKHGLIGMTKVVGIETANSGITCNAICPGWVLTPLVEKQIADQAKQKGIPESEARNALLSEKQPMLQFTTPQNLGELVLFLCSDAAASMTGSAYSMDGGWTAQ